MIQSINKTGLLFLALMAWQLQTQAAVIEEVVVTATKRGDQSIQDIAGGINALSGDDLQDRGILDFEGFAGSIPGLQFQDLGPGDKEYIIRGINGNGPAVVGAYFDEYVITSNDQQDGGGKSAPIKLVDLERIEVLNGPQGTLYGANSMAGNIKFIPRKPDAEAFDAYLDSDFSATKEGGFNYTFSGAVNIPLVENVLALRVVGVRTDNDGWIDQPRLQDGPTSFTGNAKDINDEQTNGGRIMLRWTPNDKFTLDLMYLNQDLETGGSPRFTAKGATAWPALSPEVAAAATAVGIGLPVAIPGLQALTPSEDFVNTDITVNPRNDEAKLWGATAAYQFDVGTATVSASNFKHDINFVFDSTPVLAFFGVPVPGSTVQPQTYETTMVEARFASSLDGPFNFVAGFFYQQDKNRFEVQVPTTDGRGNPAQPWDPSNANDFFGGGTAFFGRLREDKTTQKAVFGEVTYSFMDRFELLVGVRAFETEQESVQQTLHNFGGSAGAAAGITIGTNAQGNAIGLIEINDNTVKPKVSLAFDVSDDIMVYGLYSEGYRVGGVNNANQPFSPGVPPFFDSDKLENIEFGIKSRLLDGALQVNASIFLIDWSNIQVEPRDPVSATPFTTNGGAAEVNGFEWAVKWLANDNLQFDLTGTYLFDHELSSDQPALAASPLIIVGLKGDTIPNTPDLQLYASATYDTELMGKPFSFIADMTYRDSTDTEFRANDLFNIHLDSYAVFNLFASMQVTEHFSVGAYVKNLSDELAVYDGINTFQDPASLIAARPRTVGATLKWAF
ncbi:MAG: iron complex outermembrane receptor protein [Planctomycetota bacterium]|jgi:iron complex outermembrane receptor protein